MRGHNGGEGSEMYEIKLGRGTAPGTESDVFDGLDRRAMASVSLWAGLISREEKSQRKPHCHALSTLAPGVRG